MYCVCWFDLDPIQGQGQGHGAFELPTTGEAVHAGGDDRSPLAGLSGWSRHYRFTSILSSIFHVSMGKPVHPCLSHSTCFEENLWGLMAQVFYHLRFGYHHTNTKLCHNQWPSRSSFLHLPLNPWARHCCCCLCQWVAAWLGGRTLVSINEVTLRRARVVVEWVTVCEWVDRLGL